MSAQPNVHIETGSEHSVDAVVELPTEQTIAWNLAQGTPESAMRADVSPRTLFLAAQIGMCATTDWRLRADWVSVYVKATGPCGDV